MSEQFIFMGEHTYGKSAIRYWSDKVKLYVGKYCSISHEATFFLGGNHRMDWISTFPFAEKLGVEGIVDDHVDKDIIIGNDVWIGSNAVILSGAKIGDGVVVGNSCVVAKEIDPYSVIVGNPARVVRKRFSDEDIKTLLEIKWWDWPTEKVKKYAHILSSGNIQLLKEVA